MAGRFGEGSGIPLDDGPRRVKPVATCGSIPYSVTAFVSGGSGPGVHPIEG